MTSTPHAPPPPGSVSGASSTGDALGHRRPARDPGHQDEPADQTSPSELSLLIASRIREDGGWWPFDRFMSAALYSPGLGYYSSTRRRFGLMPESGSDFVTAPELSALFGQALSVQILQALEATGTDEVYEFGAGTGALAAQLLQALGEKVGCYTIIEVSGHLRQQQQEALSSWGSRVRWLDAWPERLQGVVLGNEVLDAMPVQLLHWDGQQWLERGVAVQDAATAGQSPAASDVSAASTFRWADRPTPLRPPREGRRPLPDERIDWASHFMPGTITEIHLQAEAFLASLAQRLQRGAAFFIDYGFPESEYYHPQRMGGTLMCHHRHRADANPLELVGEKDITAHVNFTSVALAAQDAGLAVLGYTSQAHFLMNCGIVGLMESASVAQRAQAFKLIAEHEMGELFKVIGLAAGEGFEALGFVRGDRSHTL